MNSLEELVSYGINEYTARSMIEAYKSRIGTENGDYTITDVEYQRDTGERKVTQVCRRCGSVNIRFLKCGRDKFSDLRQRCDCIEKDRKLKEKEDRYYAELKRKEEERSQKCEKEIWEILSRKTPKMKYGDFDIGKQFGYLTVIGHTYASDKNGRQYIEYVCACDCGNIYCVIPNFLYEGRVKSCGCKHDELCKKAATKHGLSGERLYKVWANMKSRCFRKSSQEYKNYGGRGITVCKEWLDYESFRNWALEAGYDPLAPFSECTIDRIDVNGNYEPGNCRWANAEVQGNNKRTNVLIEHDGEIHTLSEWGKITGAGNKFGSRIKNGYSFEKASCPEKQHSTGRKTNDPKCHSIRVRFNKAEKEWLKMKSKENGICVSELIREIMQEKMNRYFVHQ